MTKLIFYVLDERIPALRKAKKSIFCNIRMSVLKNSERVKMVTLSGDDQDIYWVILKMGQILESKNEK